MNPGERLRIEAVFHDALDRPEAERAAFLDQACGTDATMREHVESLLARAAAPAHPSSTVV